MAYIEDKIQQVQNKELRDILLAEVKKLKKEKKFGLAFEEHLPELVPVYSAPIRPRSIDDTLIIDILEPHNPALADSWAKAVGLAKFASKHGDRVGRIELIRVEGNHIKRLDVNDNHNRQKVLAINGNQHLDQLFANI